MVPGGGDWRWSWRGSRGLRIIDGTPVPVLSERDPASIDWGKYATDIVIESTGKFRTRDAAAHLKEFTAPPVTDKRRVTSSALSDEVQPRRTRVRRGVASGPATGDIRRPQEGPWAMVPPPRPAHAGERRRVIRDEPRHFVHSDRVPVLAWHE